MTGNRLPGGIAMTLHGQHPEPPVPREQPRACFLIRVALIQQVYMRRETWNGLER